MRLSCIKRGVNRRVGLLKTFLVNRHVLKQPNRSEKKASTRVDVVVDILLRALGSQAARFEEKPQSEQDDILIYLLINWEDIQQDSSVIEALRNTKFVTSAEGDLCKPKDLFDPGDALLTSLFSSEARRFPGERFVSDGWLSILRKTGLQNTRDADADTVLQCARRIEFLGAQSMKETEEQVSLEIWSMAETLIKTLFRSSADLLHDHGFCSEFGKIACVPADRNYSLERGKKCVKRVLCSYNHAVLLKDWSLAWTTAPILSNESLVPPDSSWEAFQLTSPPPFTIVFEHLQANMWVTEPSLYIERASLEVLTYLDQIWETLAFSDVSKLSNLAFIPTPDGTFLGSASFFFTSLKINLRSMAYELPLHYQPFVKILKELGLHDALSISSAIMFLSILSTNVLNPNALRAVVDLLNFICDEIEQRNDDVLNWDSNLVVPDNDCRLVRLNMCVYVDPYGSRYLKYIDCSKIRFVHHDVSERLCLTFGIKKLSDVVVEELDRVQNLEKIGSVSLAAIRLKLLTRSFQVAVSRVVRNFSKTTSGFNNPDFLTLRRSLESVSNRLQFVKSISTRFWLLPEPLDITCASMVYTLPEWEHESSHRALYYVNRSNTIMLIAEPPSYVPVLDLVAIVISHILGSPVPLPIGSLFFCPQDSESELVDNLKLASDDRGVDNVYLGRDILPQDAMQVQFKPLRPFYKGEIVAWQSQNGEKLKYGRIIEDVRPSIGETLYRFSLETSPQNTETIISSHVFWFANFSTPCKSSTHRHATSELEQGRVPANEFVQALEEMLYVAGINMDTDKQRLHQNILSLQERLDKSQAALLIEQERSQIAENEVHIAEAAILCRICLTNEISITVDPCGHVLCHSCSSQLSSCPYCCVQLSRTIKIYRS